MSFSTTLLAPLVLMLPVAGAVEPGWDVPPSAEVNDELPYEAPAEYASNDGTAQVADQAWTMHGISTRFGPEPAHQVRIEQRMTIRITPRSQMPPNAFVDLPQRTITSRVVERPIGKCLDASRIAGVQSLEGNRLLLFMENRRMVSATLERTCRARDFYSGFYLANSSDGRLCVERDTLQSRSGATCKLTRISRLVEVME